MESKGDNKFWILKVPEYQRHPSVEYTPVEWRFGLHNRDENLYMSDSEAAKRAVAVLYGLDKELDWTRFCDAVVPDPRAMSECYGLHKEVNVSAHAFNLERWMKLAVCDGMSPFMEISDDFYEGANAAHTLSRSHHILDVAYKVICGVDGIDRKSDFSQEDYIHVSSATRLKDSGIRIEGVAAPLSAMSYNKKKKCLYLPKMRLHDNTVSAVRNMARYEQYMEGRGCMFHDYVILMLDLIQTPVDVDHLVKCGVISNACGNKAATMWGALEEGLTPLLSSTEHNVMKSDIRGRCKLRRHRLRSEFKTLFLSRPWLTLSMIAITLVTFATLIQTYVAIINSNKMKPQFKP